MSRLLLDKKAVRMKTLTVSGSLELRTEDLSGEGSGTDSVSKGIKPKTLQVTGVVPFNNSQHLKDLLTLAEAKNEKGELKTYQIINETAAASGIRQVQFADRVSWNEGGTMQAWSVSFTLREVLSIAEMKEQREKQAVTAPQTNEGQAVGAPAASLEKVIRVASEVLG